MCAWGRNKNRLNEYINLVFMTSSRGLIWHIFPAKKMFCVCTYFVRTCHAVHQAMLKGILHKIV